ncbi:MAG: glycosyltransferase family 4 protein [Pseudomonadota bacterium]
MPPTPAAPRIAYLTGEFPAVSHTFILREIEALRELGLEVETCSIRETDPQHHRGPSEKHAAATTFYVIRAAKNPLTTLRAKLTLLTDPGRFFRTFLLALRTGSPGIKARLYQMFYFTEAMVLAHHLKSRNVTHLHNHFADSSASVAMLAAELADIGFSFTLHGPGDLFEAQKWRLDEKTRRAKFVACISHFARSQLMYFSDPADWDKLKIIHCGVTPEMYEAGDRDSDGCHLVFVGRVTAVKGLRVLLEAFGHVAGDHSGLRLTIVGDGDDREVLEDMARPLGDAVYFTGYLSQAEVAETLATADALVLPSFAEGVPVVLMEAMASGRPVIATRVAGVSELVEDGVSGFLAPPGDATGFADRIVQLASNPDLRKRMGQAGREKVLAEFDIRKEAARIAKLFRGDLGDGPRPKIDG